MNKSFLSIIILVILTVFKLNAQEKNKYGILDSTNFQLNELVVSAGKFEENRINIPNQIQVLTKKSLEFGNFQTSADVLQTIANTFIQKSQMGGGSPILRGFEANKVLMVIDGVRMNNAIYRGGHLQNVLRVDNNMFEKSEIIFGPGSVIYGSDALGGVMYFKTLDPVLSDSGSPVFKVNSFVRYSTVNKEKTGHAFVSAGWKKIGFLAAFTYSEFDDLMQGKTHNPLNKDYHGLFDRKFYVQRINGKDSVFVNKNPEKQSPTGYSQWNLMSKISFAPTKWQQHILAVHYTGTTNVPRYDRLTEVSKNLPKNAEWYYGPELWTMANYQFKYTKPVSVFDQIMFSAAYQKIEESRHSRKLNSKLLKNQNEYVDVYTANLDAMKNLNKHTLRYGFEAFLNKVESKAHNTDITTGTETPTDTRYPDGGSTMSEISVYLTNQYSINNKFVLNGGLRYNINKLESKFDSKQFFPFPYDKAEQNSASLCGNIGLVWLPGNNFKISTLFSNGYRVPNVDDMTKIFESVAGKLIVPNPDLKPEYSYNAELNIEKSINNKTRISVSGWYNYINNALTLEKSTFNGADSMVYNGSKSGIFTMVNKQEAYITGIDFTCKSELFDKFVVSAGINYTYGRIITDSTPAPLDHIPPVFGRISAQYQFKNFIGEAYCIFNGKKKLEDYKTDGEDNLIYATPDGMPAWYTLNLKLMYRINNNIMVNAGIDNIMDYNYRTFASGISAPGRNFTVSLRVKI